MELAELIEQIKQIVFELCQKNPDYIQIIMGDLNNPSIRNVSFGRARGGNIKIDFEVDTLTGSNSESLQCSLLFSNNQFKYNRKCLKSDGKVEYQYYSCAKENNRTAFYQDIINVRSNSQTDNYDRTIHSINSFEIHGETYQLYAEKNEVNLECKSPQIAQKSLQAADLKMKLANKHALLVLKKLGLLPECVEKNRSIHTELFPLENNGIVQLTDSESTNVDLQWDYCFNEQTLSVGLNDYASHEQLSVGRMYKYNNRDGKKLATDFFKKNISISELQVEASKLLEKYSKNKPFI